MKHTQHLGRWIAIGAAALTAVGAGGAATASAPPSSPPSEAPASSDAMAAAGACDTVFERSTAAGDTAAAGDTTATAETAAAGDTTAAEDTAAAGDTTAAAASAAPMSSEPAGSTPASGAPLVQTAETAEYGTILVDAECRALYAFTQDAEGESTCFEGCAVAWPPLLVPDGEVPPLGEGLDATLFSVVDHPEGPMLKVGDWPLYYFANDAAPGDINGQGANDVWWVVAPDGSLIETPPPGSEPADTASGLSTAGDY